MEEQFLEFCEKNNLFTHHRRVLIALSGGLDSMNLYELLEKNKERLKIQLVLAHVNHGQRPESNIEERELQAFAKNKNTKLYVAHYSGDFTEAKARTFRYDFFKEIMEKENCTALVTGHQANDQSETTFMRLIRGARLRHLSGISVRQPFGKGELLRPLLSFTKDELMKIPHFEDRSNHSQDYFRNRVRNQYLPELEIENPRVQESFRFLAEEVTQWHHALKELTRNLTIQDLASFRTYSSSVQSFLLEEYLAQFPDLQLGKAQFQELLAQLRKKKNTIHYLKANYEVHQEYDFFEIRKISQKSDDQSLPFLLECGNIFEIANYRLSFGQPLEGKKVEIISVSRETPLLIRKRKEGDWLLLNGHRQKLRRWFINHKIPISVRQEACIIEQNDKILSVLGLVTSDLSKPSKNDIMKDSLYIQKIDR